MTTNEAVGTHRVFAMQDDGDMRAVSKPYMTAAEGFAFIDDVAKDSERAARDLGVYRKTRRGWEEQYR